MIRIQDLFFQYQSIQQKQKHINDAFSLSLPEWTLKEGECTVFFGASGCGKSTLLKCISGQLVPQEGQIMVCGTDITKLSDEQRRLHRLCHIGIVFQDYPLVPYLNAIENVLLPFRIHPTQHILLQHREYAQQLLMDLGLEGKEQRLPQKLSQGEKQRVAIARALVVKPKLLLADEPTAGLDMKRSQNIIDLIFRLRDTYNLSVIVVTHDEGVKTRFSKKLDVTALQNQEANP